MSIFNYYEKLQSHSYYFSAHVCLSHITKSPKGEKFSETVLVWLGNNYG